ncbi:hypothetical protein ASPZODRAFT_16631 [Penicilliopsis zonata CBS 506.65]|uniref:Uncharacterized protein n=1 Tax=Penicilliopsis zonata CBS 506.65 TaxID=1073090 RepID=A0A1L9SFI1_9EURO|nr:hypothetical protein ASPZODRAFT_16631 [Penicilliopsis zonata CBS 506.65]OJJ46035.1 hypothetical protein ASPZODRAFT_16631 [Penicilliopsis zonata CBS 506.65]
MDVLNGVLGVCIEGARREAVIDISFPSRRLLMAYNFRRSLAFPPDHHLGNSVNGVRVNLQPLDYSQVQVQQRQGQESRSQTPDWSRMGLRFGEAIGSSSRHLSVYGLDFGPEIGQIENFEIVTLAADGTCTIMPETKHIHLATGKALWDVRIALLSAVMDCFENNPLIGWLEENDDI